MITRLGLAVRDLVPGEPYGLATEVDAVNSAAQARGLSRYHLLGFSAGATVALAATLALGQAVQTLTLLEAAGIGDDDWHPAETEFRASLASLVGRVVTRFRHSFPGQAASGRPDKL